MKNRLYILALVGLFISVSSMFFEREKGFGLTTDKKDKGYSRWAKDKEMKAELKEVDPKAYSPARSDGAYRSTGNITGYRVC